MTPLEERLMRYLDGEIDAAERPEIEKWLEGSPEARATLSSLELVRDAVRAIGEDTGAGGDGIADAVMAALDGPGARVVERVARPEALPASGARSVGRRWMGLAPALGLGLAAAAAVVVYFRPVPSRPGAVRSASPTEVLVAPLPAAEPSEQGPAPATGSEPGASIESIDFGARAGTIFMVSSGSDPDDAETPVVWLMDEVAPTRGRMAPL